MRRYTAVSQLSYEQFEEAFQELCKHNLRIIDLLTRRQYQQAAAIRKLRERQSQLIADKMTLKQQLAEYRKFEG